MLEPCLEVQTFVCLCVETVLKRFERLSVYVLRAVLRAVLRVCCQMSCCQLFYNLFYDRGHPGQLKSIY